MAKVTINSPEKIETPTQAILKKTQATIKDARGRTLVIKKPSFSERIIYQAVLKNMSGLGDKALDLSEQAFPLVWLISLNGELINTPTRLSELRLLLDDLDDEGYEALIEGILEIQGKAETKQEATEALKKS